MSFDVPRDRQNAFPPGAPATTPDSAAPVLEIRTYRLRPGATAEFDRLMRTEAVPLLIGFGLRVIGHGATLAREDGAEEYVLLRAFDSLASREIAEQAFYGSRAWRTGPSVDIVSRIESYHNVVLHVPSSAIDALEDGFVLVESQRGSSAVESVGS